MESRVKRERRERTRPPFVSVCRPSPLPRAEARRIYHAESSSHRWLALSGVAPALVACSPTRLSASKFSGPITCQLLHSFAMSTCVARLRPSPSRFVGVKRTQAPTFSHSSRQQSQSIACRAHASVIESCPRSGRLQLQTAFQTFQMHRARYYHDDATAKIHRAFIALGSNMGNRVAMIEEACKEMESTGKIHMVRTSSLWETKAMYVLDQDNFLNAACEVCYAISQPAHMR